MCKLLNTFVILGNNKKDGTSVQHKVVYYRHSLTNYTCSVISKDGLSLSFTGLLHVRQVPHLNCLASQLPDHKDLAFKLKRKQFSIEVCCQSCSAYPGFLHK